MKPDSIVGRRMNPSEFSRSRPHLSIAPTKPEVAALECQIRGDSSKPPLDRIIEIIKKTEGKGMTTLAKPGWFTIPDKKRRELKTKPGTPFHFLHLEDSSKSIEELKIKARLEWPEPDDELKGHMR